MTEDDKELEEVEKKDSELYEKTRWKSFKKGEVGEETRTCPACGRETSKELKECEHCTSHQDKRWSVRGILAVGIAMLLIGTIFLSLGAVHEEPVMKIENISEEDSFQHMRLKGEVVSLEYQEVKYSDYGRLQFTIFDGTGLCSVYIDQETLKTLVEKEKLPYMGDKVDIQGSFTGSGVEPTTYNGEKVMKADGSVSVTDADLFELERGDYQSFGLEKVSTAGGDVEEWGENDKVTLRGYVGDYRELSSGQGLFYLYHGRDYIPVLVPHYSLELSGGWENELYGKMVTVRGGLRWYQPHWRDEGGEWEMVADGMENIQVLDTELTYSEVGIEELSSAYQDSFTEGAKLQITGSFESSSNISAGEIIDIHDGPTSVKTYIPWYTKSVREKRENLKKGDIVQIKGTIQWYSYGEGGEWELIPDGSGSINIEGQREYQERTISTLMSDPESHDYEYVKLDNVVVTSINWNTDSEGNYYTKSFFVKASVDSGESLNIYIDYWEGRLTDLQENDTLDIQGLFKSYTYDGETHWEVVIRENSRDEISMEVL
ncbi:MAG: hypothetical protein V5A88_05730 [Candidatus Thermoplasmatota archaeon]